jgi:DNA ligase D-like protein (predicted ligase)
MKAVLSDQPFSDPDWIFERKLDGIRCLAIRDGSGVRLMSRTAHRMNDQFPEIAAALEREPAEDFIADGELVAFRDGITSFERLQQRHRKHVPVFLYLFDLARLGGEDLRPLPLRERKSRLRSGLRFDDPIRFNPHRRGEHGEELFREACRKGLEGVIAKRADSPYRGGRSRDWLKLKCHAEQELVIGGFTAPKGSRTEFGALLLGYHDGGAFRYAGKVGTGFDHETLRDLGAQMRALGRDDPPFTDAEQIRERGSTWVEPELVAQVAFTEWTRAGRLRHPRFLGLRDDKPAGEVVREG